jgi:hypothetical protein
LSPYIGKLKSSIAGDLVDKFSKAGDLVIDPFAGAGTILLEANIRRRKVFGSDISPYARILSKAKLSPPSSLMVALALAEEAFIEASRLPLPDLRKVPLWVRKFYHPATLREILNFATVCRNPKYDFLMACLLGILHHQRPGFLSYPSSHLVPYLRDRKYPRSQFPEMYTYRELKSRLLAKIKRSYKRFVSSTMIDPVGFEQVDVKKLAIPNRFGALITSPPYMNALDYGRDNRLRLWFVDPNFASKAINDITQRQEAFVDAITSLAKKVEKGLRKNGYCVFVVGEEFKRSFVAHPSETVINIIRVQAPSLRFKSLISDEIPDVRRTRRNCKAVKTEHILVFQRN